MWFQIGTSLPYSACVQLILMLRVYIIRIKACQLRRAELMREVYVSTIKPISPIFPVPPIRREQPKPKDKPSKPKPKSKIEINMGNSYKCGMNEVVGLREAIAEAFKPVLEVLRSNAYWYEELDFDDVEYLSRDGFIPHSHNKGGLMIGLHVPKCEEYDFSFLEFGECDGCNKDCNRCCGAIDDPKDPDYNHGECHSECDNQLGAYLRIWFKFEGINEDGELEFYINACGGNGDAPYFRVEHLTDLFDASFTAKSVIGVTLAAAKHIKALVKILRGTK